MYVEQFIHDMAIIMLIAGIVTVIFHRLRQPVVLGYIVAGVIIGPHTPPFELIQDKHTIKVLAELGVVFLMFSLGLEFSLKKLARVGATSLIAALAEISLMIWLGYQIGHFFGWKTMDSLFLGAMLAISSTTIIIKALNDLGMKQENFAQLIFGILIVEDILSIGMIALLSGIATTGSVGTMDIISIVGRLSLFIIVSLVLGLLLVTRLLAYVAKFRSNEMLLITVLGLCFGFCLLVIKLNYSIALGAFIMGAIIAEARPLQLIVKLVEPIRDMFSAIFFVTIGMLFEPRVMITYALPIAVITIAVVIGKVVACTAGTFVVGHSGRTSFRVGMGLAQIGEFSFIIASLGLSLKVTSGFLYPIVVAVSAITTLLTPYLIKTADKVTTKPAASNPSIVSKGLNYYTKWLERMQPNGDNATLVKIIIRISLQIIVNCALVAAVFLAGVFMIASVERNLLGNAGWLSVEELQKTIICGGALFISLPFLIAAYRKLKALSMLFAEMVISRQIAGRHTFTIRKIIYELVPLLAIAGIMSLVFSFSAAILPPPVLLEALMIGAIIVALVLWKPFVWFHSWLQILLFDVMRQEKTQDKS